MFQIVLKPRIHARWPGCGVRGGSACSPWQAALAGRGEHVARSIQDALNGYEMVLDVVTARQPITEAWMRRLHEVLCASQETHEVVTAVGLQEQPLAKGQYKVLLNNPTNVDTGRVFHYAPVADTPPEMHRLAAELDGAGFKAAHPVVQAAYAHYAFVRIHPFADGNGRLGRLWQTLILTGWNPLFAHILVESLVHEHQQDYYRAIHDSTVQTDAAPFIAFMLAMMRDAIAAPTPQVAPHVTPQVMRLLRISQGPMSRDELQAALGLKDRKSFRERYLRPGLEAGLIAMTLPDKPNSRLQKYRRTLKSAL